MVAQLRGPRQLQEGEYPSGAVKYIWCLKIFQFEWMTISQPSKLKPITDLKTPQRRRSALWLSDGGSIPRYSAYRYSERFRHHHSQLSWIGRNKTMVRYSVSALSLWCSWVVKKQRISWFRLAYIATQSVRERNRFICLACGETRVAGQLHLKRRGASSARRRQGDEGVYTWVLDWRRRSRQRSDALLIVALSGPTATRWTNFLIRWNH